jgi:uncharacterized protein (TIGR00730 family)
MPVERSMWFREEEDLERDLAFMRDEFRSGFELIARIDRPAVSIFGSARTPPDHEWYVRTMAIAAGFVREGFAVITGGGPGIMEAGNRGAKEAGGLSVGLGIALPSEPTLNPWIDLAYEFKHFYARKVCFVKASEGFVACPGGWGTNDELYEALTLIQTRKVVHFPVVLFGTDHWEPFQAWSETMLAEGLIADADLDLYTITDDPEQAVRTVVACFRRECGHAAAP